jgi:hypothetical protein
MSARPCIAERVGVARRYVRSIDVRRDLDDPAALDGYVPTPTVDDTLHRLLRGLADGSTHRAFRITGPYGAGKSAFLLFLARLFQERREPSAATVLLAMRCPDRLSDLAATRAYEPLVVIGRRAPVADLILEALAHKVDGWRAPGRRPAVADVVLRLQAERREGRRDDSAVLDALREFARYVDRSHDGRGGVLLLIDEMGRCLEHAASREGGNDTSVFQALGEMAAGTGDAPVAVVGVLHQRFAEYASALGNGSRADWARSAERFEDLPFQESLEQVSFLLAEAIKVVGSGHDQCVTEAAGALYREAADLGLFPGRSAEIASLGPRLYPMHPAAVVALSAMARRFGQNERSAVGFLQSFEPGGFRDYAAETPYGPDSWYGLANLFDHVATRGEGGPRDGLQARRWRLLTDTLTAHRDLPPIEAAVLKCVGLLSVLDPLPGLRADLDSLAFCLHPEPRAAVEEALSALVRRRMVYRRPHRSDHCLWASSSVDLDGWLAEARRQCASATRIGSILAVLPAPRPIVAHKHYHETGTLRAFGVRFTTDGATLNRSSVPGVDGWIVVHPVHPDDDRAAVMDAAVATADLDVLHCVREVPPALLAAANEVQVWTWVAENCGELQVDDLARREVREHLAEAGAALADRLVPFAGPASEDEAATTWVHAGRIVPVPDRAALHRLLSDICDRLFESAPVVHNELINRSRLSSAAASARMRLLERMASGSGDRHLGLTGAPPEKAILLSVLQAGGLHRLGPEGHWTFVAPPEGHPARWHGTWSGLEAILAGPEPIGLDEVVQLLAKPPFGIRQGVSLVLITAFLLARRSDVALFERNTFVPDVTGALLMRVARNPRHFSLRLVAPEPDRAAVLERLAAAVTVWATRPVPEAASVTEALMRWFIALPAYSRETRSVGPLAHAVRTALGKARDPIELVFEALPAACGLSTVEAHGRLDAFQYASVLDECLHDIGTAYPRVRAEAAKVVLDAFGARSIGKVRDLVRLDYLPFETALADTRMRAFVKRSADPMMADDAWLDSVASLLTGRRPDAWRDRDLDTFMFEVRALVPRLARWLAAARAGVAARAPVLSVHVVSPDGGEASLVVHPDEGGREDVSRAIRALLQGRGDAAFLLGQLLSEEVRSMISEEAQHAGS